MYYVHATTYLHNISTLFPTLLISAAADYDTDIIILVLLLLEPAGYRII